MGERRDTVTLGGDDVRLLHSAASIAVDLYDAVEKEGGVPKHAPLYGKRDRLVELARQLDHEANCILRASALVLAFRAYVESTCEKPSDVVDALSIFDLPTDLIEQVGELLEATECPGEKR